MPFHNTAALWAAVLLLFALAGCTASDFGLPTPTLIPLTATVTQTPTSTATIIWFPATATFTPAPTMFMTPTPDLRPPLGKVLLEDPFTDKTQWLTGRSGSGSMAYGKGEFTLAVSASRGTLATLRKRPMLDDYYLQVEALPSLCLNEDTYGLLLRASSVQDAYRLLVTCSGKLRLERVKGGRVLPLQDWTQSGQIFPGGMMRTRLGVWVQGEDMHVFIDDVYQFSVRDTVWDTGALGLFARSSGDTPLTVSYSNLVVYQVSYGGRPLPAATAKAPVKATTTATAIAKAIAEATAEATATGTTSATPPRSPSPAKKP